MQWNRQCGWSTATVTPLISKTCSFDIFFNVVKSASVIGPTIVKFVIALTFSPNSVAKFLVTPSSDGVELITFKIKRHLSEDDQKARLNSFRDYIFNVGVSLGLSDSSVMSIVSSVEPEDYTYACSKLGEIMTYVLLNRSPELLSYSRC